MAVSAAPMGDAIHLSRRAVGRVMWAPVHGRKSSAPHRSRGATMADKTASPDYPIHEPLAQRWSPYAFADRLVPEADVRSLFEAARWAPSSFNEQPWRYLVATKDDPEQFQRLLSCLVEGNQIWAKAAPALALGVVSLRFARNAQDNRAAVHDLGLAAGNLLVEATVRGLCVHQMIGILPDKAREVYGIPEGFEAWTGLAIGYKGDPTSLPARLRERDLAPRHRKPLREFVFSGRWDNPSPLVLGGDASR
jgi:nitroreductase